MEFSYSDTPGNSIVLYASAAYLGSSTGTLAGPDFSSAGAYLAAYGLAVGTVKTTLIGIGSSGAVCTEGATTKEGYVTGTN